MGPDPHWTGPGRSRGLALDQIALDQANATMDLDEVEALLISMPPSSSAGRPRLKASTISGTNLTDTERAELNELVSDALRSARLGA